MGPLSICIPANVLHNFISQDTCLEASVFIKFLHSCIQDFPLIGHLSLGPIIQQFVEREKAAEAERNWEKQRENRMGVLVLHTMETIASRFHSQWKRTPTSHSRAQKEDTGPHYPSINRVLSISIPLSCIYTSHLRDVPLPQLADSIFRL